MAENTNGRLRRHLPRDTDMLPVPDRALRAIQDRLDATPRKCLGWRIPAGAFRDQIIEPHPPARYPGQARRRISVRTHLAAIRAVEEALSDARRAMLVAMATGTGKTKLSIARIYRLLEVKRSLRVCFVVDRSALGEQAEGASETTRMVGGKTFAEIFWLRGFTDRDIDRDAKVHVCTVQSLVQRVLGRGQTSARPSTSTI